MYLHLLCHQIVTLLLDSVNLVFGEIGDVFLNFRTNYLHFPRDIPHFFRKNNTCARFSQVLLNIYILLIFPEITVNP